jgi:LacI family transcriptional regulator
MISRQAELGHRLVDAARRLRDARYPEWEIVLLEPNRSGYDRFRQRRVEALIGVVADLPDRALLGSVPVVQLSRRFLPGYPLVVNDEVEIGRLGARTLCEDGHRHLAMLTFPLSHVGFHGRRLGFVEVAGVSVPIHAWKGYDALGAWIASLPQPIGLFCANDVLALWASDTCQDLGLRMPEDVAILGVDDDATICPFANPPLSSIAQDVDGLMSAAFDLMAELLNGRNLRQEVIVPPGPVQRRRSTGAITGLDLAGRAMALIRGSQPLTVADLSRTLGVTPRAVQRAVLAAYGTTPQLALRAERIARAKRLLLAGTSVATVAVAVGYAGVPAFTEAFGVVCGESPAAWTRRRTGRIRKTTT